MKIDELRKEISDIDGEISKLFDKRLRFARQIGEYKRENGLPVKDEEVEKRKLEKILSECGEENAEYQKALFQAIFDISCRMQDDFSDATESECL